MVLIFSTHLFQLSRLKFFSFEPHFAIQVLFINNILGELIPGVDKLNLAIEYFS